MTGRKLVPHASTTSSPVVEAHLTIRQGAFVVEPVPVVDNTVSDETSNVAQTDSPASTPPEDRMPSTPTPSRKRRKAAAGKRLKGRKSQTASRERKTLRARTKNKTTASQGARGIAFRLSSEHVRLIDAKVQALNKHLGKAAHSSPSDVLRSLLVTHLLIDNPRIDGVLFMGGYRAKKTKQNFWVVLNRAGKELAAYKATKGPRGWWVADRGGNPVAMATGTSASAAIHTMTQPLAIKAARDIAFLRAEWLAQESTGSARPDDSDPRKDDTKAFRLPTDERVALQRLATQNETTLSEVLRSFLTTQLSQRKGRLREVTIGSCRIYPCPEGEGWSIRKRRALIATEQTLEKAFAGAQWETTRAA